MSIKVLPRGPKWCLYKDFKSSHGYFTWKMGRYNGRVIALEIRDDLSKVSEVGGILGRAGTVGLGKAVEVLDTLGSSMTNLNPVCIDFGTKDPIHVKKTSRRKPPMHASFDSNVTEESDVENWRLHNLPSSVLPQYNHPQILHPIAAAININETIWDVACRHALLPASIFRSEREASAQTLN
ncbi:hypothetical protein POM88_017354 [Heracleum sosnowskyi]|uniref:Uncharacterized protein n=1 Tax=Heracleum sosnowskyi TaxID=360622 RepID=A0AAD8MY09_9APIA|nr:hypothetical protein POM88_017354 [Heracleum sosnowskyi]